MNITTDELLNELRNGKNAEDLANQLIESLNEANVKYQEEQEAATAKASLTEKNNDCIACITDDLNEYFKNNNCDSLVFTEDEVASILQGAVQLADLLSSLRCSKSRAFSTLVTKKDNAATAVKNKITNIDEVIANWIDKLN